MEEAPMGIVGESRKEIWSIKEWNKLSHILANYRKDYPVPIYEAKPELQYWAATKSYVYYVIISCARSRADMKKPSYKVCDKTMIIDATTGRVILKKSKMSGMMVVQPQ